MRMRSVARFMPLGVTFSWEIVTTPSTKGPFLISAYFKNASITHFGHVVVVHGLERQLVLGFLLAQHLENFLALGCFGLF
jgi:hypothetical protein